MSFYLLKVCDTGGENHPNFILHMETLSLLISMGTICNTVCNTCLQLETQRDVV